MATMGATRVWEGYPPPPHPVGGDVDVAAYVFPGWYRDAGRGDYPYRTHDEDSEWRLVARQPKPRPLLGFYDDSLPEVNDWHITWALEHGISIFVFDWYWNAGEHRLLRTLEQGFLPARYAPMMKFCIHWCNHGLDWRTRQWYPMMGLRDAVVNDGVLTARTSTNDPAFACPVRIDASAYTRAVIRMKLTGTEDDPGGRGPTAQLFWGGSEGGESEANSVSFTIMADGRFHEYVLDLGAVATWRGSINRLRFDPTGGEPGALVALDSIRLLRSANARVPDLAWEFDGKQDFRHLTAGGLDLSEEALCDMTVYLAEHYFRRPNYWTVNGRPVLFIWDTKALFDAHGGPRGFRRVLAKMNAILRTRGIGDLFLVSVHGGRSTEAAGFDAVSGYGYYGADFDAPYEWRGGYGLPYELVVKHYQSMWRAVGGGLHVPYIVPIGSNWDSRPRAGSRAAVVTGKTPELFRALCRQSLKVPRGPLNTVIIEAWNEWGEGSFIEPDREWDFAFLDVVREVFTEAPREHVDLVPTAAKIASFSVLSPAEVAAARKLEGKSYPDPPALPRSVRWRIDAPLPQGKPWKQWEFNGTTTEGWTSYQLDSTVVRDGVLSVIVAGSDPHLVVDDVGVPIGELQALALRLRVSRGVTRCQVFWSTEADPKPSANKSFLFPLRDDDAWHTYQVGKRVEGAWRGRLKMLRLDMGGPGDHIDVDWIRLLKK